VREEVFLPSSCGSMSADTTADVNPMAVKNAVVFLAVSHSSHEHTGLCMWVSVRMPCFDRNALFSVLTFALGSKAS
jgi:hypothetical protein